MITENPLLRAVCFIGLFIVMFLLESFKPARPWKDSRLSRFRFGISLAVINNIFIRLFLFAPLVYWTHLISEKGWGLASFLNLPLWLEIPITVVLFDLFDAYKHLWYHRLDFLWKFHRVHHTDTHLDIFTILRYHPGELALSAIIKSFWLLLWGPSAISFIVSEIFVSAAAQFHHSNIELGDKWDAIIGKVIVTPRYHSIHHTIDRDKKDYNFATVFSFWDIVLRAQKKPYIEDIDLLRLGPHQENHLSLKTALLSPFEEPEGAKEN